MTREFYIALAVLCVGVVTMVVGLVLQQRAMVFDGSQCEVIAEEP